MIYGLIFKKYNNNKLVILYFEYNSPQMYIVHSMCTLYIAHVHCTQHMYIVHSTYHITALPPTFLFFFLAAFSSFSIQSNCPLGSDV